MNLVGARSMIFAKRLKDHGPSPVNDRAPASASCWSMFERDHDAQSHYRDFKAVFAYAPCCKHLRGVRRLTSFRVPACTGILD